MLRPVVVAVLAAFLSGSAHAEDDLVLHYTCEEGAGDVLRDHSPNKLHGKIHGAKWVKGPFGTALDFDGKDDFVECPYTRVTDTADAFTAEAWAYPQAPGGGIFCRVTGGGWRDERLTLTTFWRGGQQPYFMFCISDGKKYNSTQRPALELNTWTHVAATFDGKVVRVYRNGALEKGYGSGCKANVKNVPIWIGRSFGIGDRHYFKGCITDVRYYRRALSASEIRKHYQAGLKGKGQIAVAFRTTRPPKIDGRLDDPDWVKARRYRVSAILAPKAQLGTHFRLLYDDMNLYVAFECLEPTKTRELAGKKAVRAGSVWNFDCLEIFLDPEAKRERYYHLAVSPVADQYYDDQTGFKAPYYQDELWHKPWTFASDVDVAAKRWTAEVAVPFKSLGVGLPKPGDTWLGNFGRERPSGFQGETELFLWSRLGRRFNDAETFGPISFDKVTRRAEKLAASKKTVDKFMPRKPAWPDPSIKTVGPLGDGRIMIPTNQVLKPAGKQIAYPGRPLDMALSPDGKWAVVTNLRNMTLVDLVSGAKQIVPLPDGRSNSFHGVVFLPDSRTIYCAGAGGEITVFAINGEGDLEHKATHKVATRAACGLAFSDDRKRLYVADNVGNSLVVCDASNLQPIERVRVGVAPYSVAVGPAGKVYVGNWGGRHPKGNDVAAGTYGARVAIDPKTGTVSNGTVSVVKLAGKAKAEVTDITVGRFPCQLIVNSAKTRLFVANGNEDTVSVIETASDKVVETIPVKPDAALPFGSQPNALALSPDQKTLYVANATNNAVSVIRLGRLAGVAGGPERSRATGMIPVGWFPGAIKVSRDGKRLYVANVRGLGAGFSESRGAYRVGNFIGLINIIDVPDDAQLAAQTRQVAENNRLQASLLDARPRRKGDKRVPVPTKPVESSVFEHIIYIIRENHTYDMDLGDMKEGEGDPRLCSCGETLTPNAHAIARQFVLLDNYHVPSVQSPTGHLWLSQGITSSYYEKGLTTWPRRYSYTGGDALAFAGCDFIWLNALKHGLTFRSYGEQVSWSAGWTDKNKEGKPKWIDAWKDYCNGTRNVTINARGNIRPMRPHVAPNFPGYGYTIPDVRRAQIFIQDLKKFEKEGGLPNLTMILLPNNHTSGGRPDFPSAAAQVADNDLALGLIAEAVSHSKFWPKTVIFCIEDDPCNGADHVAGSRSPCYIISPYTKRGKVISECYSLCGLLKTIELILGLPMMNQLDLLATPMTECFTEQPDLTPYTHIRNKIPLNTINAKLDALTGPALFWARKSLELPLMEEPDAFVVEDLEIFKRLNWYAIMGCDRPYPYFKDGKIVFEDPMKYVR